MKKKIKIQLLMVQGISLVLIAFCYVLCYDIFFPLYHNWIKEKQVMDAYLDIQDLDLAELEEKDYSMFLGYENEDLNFTIADEDLQPIYTTSENEEYNVYKNIEIKLDAFSADPGIIHRNTKLRETVKLRGILTQDNIRYYVVIKDISLRAMANKVTQQFFFFMSLLLTIFGGLAIYRISRYFAKPLEELADTAAQISQGDFSKRPSGNGAYEEAARLSQSLNTIADQLQQSKGQIDANTQRLLQQNVHQERVEKLRKNFITNISHELKTPLAVISSQAEMISYVGENDRAYYIASIQEEVAKMTDMVGGLLNISVLEHQMDSMVQKHLDMKEVIEYSIMRYDGLVKKKMIHLEQFIEEGCYVFGDQEYIEQAINNYLMNAFEHTEFGGNIRVTLKKQQEDIRVGVYNTGKPIDKADIERIWNSFYTTKKKKSGTFSNVGVGLYIVQSVITMQNGQYGVENLPKGVEFWFTLPKAQNGTELQ